jgi:hypothetical protein
MAESPFAIPKEFQNELRYIEPSDKRSDAEILASLAMHIPVTSERNIWAYWHAGLHAMPAWCQRNVVGWVKINPGWTIRVLDTVADSPNHALKFIAPEMLPESFVKGTMDGVYKGPHSADFLRGALIYTYGGVFMDVGILLFQPLDRICWAQLEDTESPFQLSVPNMYSTLMANHFVAGRKGDPFIKRWHDLFIHLWKGRTNYSGMIQNPLLQFALSMDFSESQKRGYKWEFIVEPLTVFEYITQVTAFLRLTMLEDAGDGFSGAEYAVNNILWFDALEEDWGAETVVGYRGEDAVNALATKLEADPESVEYKVAFKLVWRLLTKSSMQKITHGKNLTKTPAWGLIWDEKDNGNKDNEPGTFAELLRYGAVHFRQTRKSIAYVQIEKPSHTMKKGVFEP